MVLIGKSELNHVVRVNIVAGWGYARVEHDLFQYTITSLQSDAALLDHRHTVRLWSDVIQSAMLLASLYSFYNVLGRKTCGLCKTLDLLEPDIVVDVGDATGQTDPNLDRRGGRR